MNNDEVRQTLRALALGQHSEPNYGGYASGENTMLTSTAHNFPPATAYTMASLGMK